MVMRQSRKTTWFTHGKPLSTLVHRDIWMWFVKSGAPLNPCMPCFQNRLIEPISLVGDLCRSGTWDRKLTFEWPTPPGTNDHHFPLDVLPSCTRYPPAEWCCRWKARQVCSVPWAWGQVTTPPGLPSHSRYFYPHVGPPNLQSLGPNAGTTVDVLSNEYAPAQCCPIWWLSLLRRNALMVPYVHNHLNTGSLTPQKMKHGRTPAWLSPTWYT